jgi:hypothetical protein
VAYEEAQQHIVELEAENKRLRVLLSEVKAGHKIAGRHKRMDLRRVLEGKDEQ